MVLLYSQEEGENRLTFSSAIYDPFFSAVVTDNEGLTFNISRAEFYDEFNEKKFFFWVRRNSGLYNLSFKNIRRIDFSEDDFADDRYRNFTRCTIEMVTGEVYPVYLKTTGQIKGFEEVFSSPVSFYLHYNLIRSIEFKQSGDYRYCPFCENIYFDNEITSCLYDSTPLEEGVLSESLGPVIESDSEN